jgi:hypothetical protein
VHCSWALADSIPGAASFEYGADDDISTPLAGAGAPCAIDANTGQAHQSNGARGMLHVLADPARTGADRLIELWSVVSHPTSDAFGAGTGTVAWTIRHSGAVVGQLSATDRSCAGATEPGPMWAAASTAPGGTGAFAPATVSNGSQSGLWPDCRQGRVRVFFGRWALPAAAGCGTYDVTTTATVAGRLASLGYSFEVLCPADVLLDTTSVQWVVPAGGSASVRGDLDPTTLNAPTVVNRGQGPSQVGIVFTPLTRSDRPDTIAEFGAKLVNEMGDTTGISRVAGDVEAWFPTSSGVLCPGQRARLTLTVHAPAGIAQGDYAGSLRLIARPGGQC